MYSEKNPVTVLLVDDEVLASELIGEKLRGEADLALHYEADPSRLPDLCASLRPSVVLLDLKMPGTSGLDVLQGLRADPATQRLPVILLSSEDSPDIKFTAFSLGAHDYLVKWPQTRELVARLRYHAGAYRAQQERDGAIASLRKSQEALLRRTHELAQSQAALHQAKKLEAIGQLTGGVAHDFNNVLQLISGNLEVLRMLNAGNEAALRRIDAAAEGVERGARLSGHLLAFARRQPLQAQAVEVRSLLQGMEDLLVRALGSLVKIETAVSNDLWPVLADPTQLENVILNLALNARDAMPDGGNLVLTARNVGPHEDADGEFVQIEVSDTGSGMPPEVLERVFEPFFTTKATGQGTGLGLSMAYGFVQQSGGRIHIDSRPGAGTRVRICLPRASADAVVAPSNCCLSCACCSLPATPKASLRMAGVWPRTSSC